MLRGPAVRERAAGGRRLRELDGEAADVGGRDAALPLGELRRIGCEQARQVLEGHVDPAPPEGLVCQTLRDDHVGQRQCDRAVRYKLTRHDDGTKSMEVFDLTAEQWRAHQPVTLSPAHQNPAELFAGDDANCRFVQDLFATTLCYAADLIPEISDDIVGIDRAMQWGFNWQHGPFQLIDQLGADTLIKLCQNNKKSLPKMLQVLQNANEKSFYRNNEKEYLTADGEWKDVNN